MTKYTTIKVRKETKELLERTLIDFEAKLGKRLDYDELIRLLVIRAKGRPQMLKLLIERPVEEHNTERAQRLLREERRRDTRF